RLRAGKNVSAPTMTMTPTSSAENSGVVTGNVPADAGTRFLRPRLPAIASIGMIMKKRPIGIAIASEMLYHFVFAVRPPNADPLLPVPDVKRISDRPCGPGLRTLDVPNVGATTEMAVKTR